MSSDPDKKNKSPDNENNELKNNAKNKNTHRQKNTHRNSSLDYSQLQRTGDTAVLEHHDIPSLSLESNNSNIATVLSPIDNVDPIITPYPQDYKKSRLSEEFNIRMNTSHGKYIGLINHQH